MQGPSELSAGGRRTCVHALVSTSARRSRTTVRAADMAPRAKAHAQQKIIVFPSGESNYYRNILSQGINKFPSATFLKFLNPGNLLCTFLHGFFARTSCLEGKDVHVSTAEIISYIILGSREVDAPCPAHRSSSGAEAASTISGIPAPCEYHFFRHENYCMYTLFAAQPYAMTTMATYR